MYTYIILFDKGYGCKGRLALDLWNFFKAPGLRKRVGILRRRILPFTDDPEGIAQKLAAQGRDLIPYLPINKAQAKSIHDVCDKLERR